MLKYVFKTSPLSTQLPLTAVQVTVFSERYVGLLLTLRFSVCLCVCLSVTRLSSELPQDICGIFLVFTSPDRPGIWLYTVNKQHKNIRKLFPQRGCYVE